MKKITLIGTMHKEIGKCNGNELYDILQKIKPDVIFEETSKYKNMMTYTWGIDPNSPELRSIQKYIQNHNAECIPVDNLEKPKNFDELEKTFAIAIMDKNINNEALHELFDFSNEYMCKNGIVGMNTEYFDNLNQKKYKLCEEYIKNYKIEILDKYNEYKNYIISQREENMIEVITNFTNVNERFNAVFVIGADHRVTIIDKLKNIENIEYNFYFGHNWNVV